MDLTIEDVKNLTFELFMAQRLITQLQGRLAEFESSPATAEATPGHPND